MGWVITMCTLENGMFGLPVFLLSCFPQFLFYIPVWSLLAWWGLSGNRRLRVLPTFLAAGFLGLGAAAEAGCGAALAALMASRGMSPGTAWPFATASVCVGSLLGGWVLALLQKSRGLLWGGGLGLAYALALLGFQLAGGGVPDGAQLARLALVVLSGAAGGSAGARRTEKRRRR